MKYGLEMLCVSRMNGYTRKKLYREVVERDGEFCRCCGALHHECSLVIDHRDNYNSNNSIGNLQLLCRKCNYMKNPRPVDKCVSESKRGDSAKTELEQNQKNEWQFREYSYGRVEEQGEVPEKELVVDAAEAIDNSQVSNKRYLDKMCSVEGPFYRKRVGDTIMIKFRPNMELR